MSATEPSAPDPAPALDAVLALPGLCRFERRSGSLDGSLPLRAVQHCTPVIQGSAAGFQVVLEEPVTLARRRGRVEVAVTAATARRLQHDVDGALEALVERGGLRRDGTWARLFRGDAIPVRRGRAVFWTGWLVRPAPGLVLHIAGAYNRRSRITVRERLITDEHRYTPLVVEIDVSNLSSHPLWLEGEIACVTPLVPGVRFGTGRLEHTPAAGAAVVKFYDRSYFQEKDRHPTGRYRRLHATLDDEAAATADCRFVYAGPRTHRLRRQWRQIGPDGWSAWVPPAGAALDQAIVGSIASLRIDWDGQSLTRLSADLTVARARLTAVWRRLYGAAGEEALAFFAAHLWSAPRDEPYVAIQPWAFVMTPPGWSSIVDGVHGAAYDGMRGIFATDVFPSLSMMYRLYRPSRIRIDKGAPLLRVLAVPRALLRRSFRRGSLDDLPPGH